MATSKPRKGHSTGDLEIEREPCKEVQHSRLAIPTCPKGLNLVPQEQAFSQAEVFKKLRPCLNQRHEFLTPPQTVPFLALEMREGVSHNTLAHRFKASMESSGTKIENFFNGRLK